MVISFAYIEILNYLIPSKPILYTFVSTLKYRSIMENWAKFVKLTNHKWDYHNIYKHKPIS